MVPADKYLPLDDELMPTGEFWFFIIDDLF
jgi:hypothetical protein